MPDPAQPAPESETRLLKAAQERGILSAAQLDEALRTRQTLGETGVARAIEDILFDKGIFTPEQLRAFRQLARETVAASDVTALAGWERTTPGTRGGAASAPPDSTPGEPFGRYRLMEPLGHGGMGVVWKAWDTDLRRVVALKQILGGEAVRGQTIDRFLREARAAARLRHPNIVPVYDVGVIDGKHYLTADFVDGTSLDKRMREEMSTRDAVALVKTVAEALQYAHDQGVVHRDIKPGNILVDRQGVPHVADFGLAKDASPGSGPALTVSGDVLGTPSYMSPEQARGRPDEQGPPSDQFSLGVMLYEMVTGKLPFGGSSLQDILNAITDSEPVAPTRHQRKLHADVETVILKTLEKDPSKRYASMRALAADLGRILDAEPIEARRPGLASRLARRAAKHRGLSVAAVVLVVAGAGLAWFAWSEHVEKKATTGALQKTDLANSVLTRWGGLTEAVREMQENAWDDSITLEETKARNRRPWEEIARFMRDTPADATSQATMKALAGWARALYGEEREGLAWLAESRRLDPEVPFGALLEGLLHLTEYCKQAPEPKPMFSGAIVEKASDETPSQRALRERIVVLTVEAEGARMRVGELSAALSATLRSLDEVRSGDFARAERSLDGALGSGALQWCRVPLLLWRAMVRRRLRAFEGAFDDIAQVERVCPRWRWIPYYRGLVHIEMGLEAFDRGGDPTGACGKAVQELSKAAEAESKRENALVARAGAYILVGEWEKARGGDPCASYELAVRDLGVVTALCPTKSLYRVCRATLLVARGEWRMGHGIDATGDMSAALSDLDAVLSRDPENAQMLMGRGVVRQLLAKRAMEQQADSRELLDGAAADLRAHLALLRDPSAEAQCQLALTLFMRGGAEAESGGDPRSAWQAARTEAEAAARLAPRDVRPWVILTSLHWQAGDLDSALEACRRLAAASPGSEEAEATLAHLVELVARDGRERLAGWRRLAWLAEDSLSEGEFPRGRLLTEDAIAAAPAEAELKEDDRALLGRLRFGLARVHARLSQQAGRRHAAPFDIGEETRARHRDEAFSMLRRAIELGWSEAWELDANADLEPIRSDPRWKAIVDSLPRK